MKERSKRQSFLGDHSDELLAKKTIGVIGASGGGSPIAQQLAHVGFGTVHIIDPDFAEEHHRHRLIGISTTAVRRKWNKTRVVERLMRQVHPEGSVQAHPKRWQDVHEILRTCDLVFSCVDGYLAREEIERYLRRYRVPLIDIGMDVREVQGGFLIVGQAILSKPGGPCMRCFGFIRDELLRQEAERYGAAGERAQVVWPNGTLASAAIGMGMSLLLPWHAEQRPAPYLLYDGNALTVAPHPRLPFIPATCVHYEG